MSEPIIEEVPKPVKYYYVMTEAVTAEDGTDTPASCVVVKMEEDTVKPDDAVEFTDAELNSQPDDVKNKFDDFGNLKLPDTTIGGRRRQSRSRRSRRSRRQSRRGNKRQSGGKRRRQSKRNKH